MTLRSYLRIFRERWKILALVTVLGIALATLVTALTPKTYQSDAQIYVAANPTSSASTGTSYDQQATAQAVVQTIARLANIPQIVDAVRSNLKLRDSVSDLQGKISASAPTSQTLVIIQVTDTSPDKAAAIANQTAVQFIRVVQELNTPSDSDRSSLRLFVTERATPATSPVAPQPTLNIALGLILGFLVALALAVARDLLDNRIKDVDTLAKIAGRPVMGAVVDDAVAARHPIATRAGSRNIRAENFRQLRANLQFANVDEHPRVIAVTSSVPTEGKTMVAMNLASTLAETGFTVCLVDADLRRPTVAKVMGLRSSVGLTNVLIQQLDVTEALQSAGSNLYVLSSGPTPPNPSEVLASSYVRDIIRSLLDKVDYVVIDTAPLLPVADGSEVAALADGTLLVARHKLTTDAQVTRAVASLARVDAKLIGVVLNRIPNRRLGEYAYTYYRADQTSSAHSRKDDGAEEPRRSRSDRDDVQDD